MAKTEDDLKHKHLKGCITAFLKGKQNLNWVMSYVKGHNVSKEIMNQLIRENKPDVNSRRYNDLLESCQEFYSRD